MFLNTVFVILDSVNVEEFTFEYTPSATVFIVSPNGKHAYRLFISRVLQISAFCGFMLFKDSIYSMFELIIHLLFSNGLSLFSNHLQF